jgi:hypothetical protein
VFRAAAAVAQRHNDNSVKCNFILDDLHAADNVAIMQAFSKKKIVYHVPQMWT